MLQTSNLLVLVVLVGSSYAVFYTKSSDSEYPRIGRRAFYTSGNGYPRIGRRSGASADPSSSSESSGFPELTSGQEKRGLYTSGGGYPRVGRSGAAHDSRGPSWQQMRATLLRNLASSLSGPRVEEEEGREGEEGADKEFGLGIMFLAFDQNDDKQLSKEEFTQGMRKYRQENPFC